MGFCRRCGDIVSGPRCKCGGMPVAPVVQWNQVTSKDQNPDKWSQTYVVEEKHPRPLNRGPSSMPGIPSPQRSVSPTKRFPRPSSSSMASRSVPLSSRVSTYIASTTSRPPSPLKQSSSKADDDSPTKIASASPSADILPSPYNNSELSKVYGSVLQPKESLATHSCASCSSPFPPDATIYPDPSSSLTHTVSSPSSNSETRFLCRPCFTTNGGSKGDCPACSRPVLILKSEGGFVESGGHFWHKRCFRCEACFKHIGDQPMVDLLGRPSCAECFDNCLKRDSTPKKLGRNLTHESPREKEITNNLGGLKASNRSRDASPAIEELEQRLGIIKSRESSPTLEELTQRLSMVQKNRESPITPKYTGGASRQGSPLLNRQRIGTGSGLENPISAREAYGIYQSPTDRSNPIRYERFKSPGPGSASGSPLSAKRPTEEAIEEMKRRLLSSASPGQSVSQARSPPTSASRIPILVRNSPSGSPAPKGQTSAVSLKGKEDSYKERERELGLSPRVSDMGSPTSSLSSISFLRNHRGLDTMVSERESTRGRDMGDDLESSIPSTPDLMSDFSDKSSLSSPSPPSLPAFTPPVKQYDVFSGDYLNEDEMEPYKAHNLSSTVKAVSSPSHMTLSNADKPLSTLSGSTVCEKCGISLYKSKDASRFVTVPEEPRTSGAIPKTYHTECFRCVVCGGPFKEENGQAVFVREEGRAVHIKCATPEKVNTKKFPVNSFKSMSTATLPSTSTSCFPPRTLNQSTYTSSRCDQPPMTAPSTTTSFLRFGSTTVCPGCNKSVSPMERGVVPGPQGTRWHAGCLVCGGGVAGGTRGNYTNIKERGRWSDEKEKGKPGCGKKLDSAAKGDGEGGVWCRECLLLLPPGARCSPQSSPSRGPLVASHTGGTSITPQFTGATTLARQFTGIGGADISLMRQLTGGGLSPTRHLASSPTKQLGQCADSVVRRPRPKSVIGMRGKSIDEGRGMFLVRQMTGGGVRD